MWEVQLKKEWFIWHILRFHLKKNPRIKRHGRIIKGAEEKLKEENGCVEVSEYLLMSGGLLVWQWSKMEKRLC